MNIVTCKLREPADCLTKIFPYIQLVAPYKYLCLHGWVNENEGFSLIFTLFFQVLLQNRKSQQWEKDNLG